MNKPPALPQYLANYMASCAHSAVGTQQGLGPLLPVYFCLHPDAKGLSGPGICGAMGGSLAGSKTIKCHRIYTGPEAIRTKDA